MASGWYSRNDGRTMNHSASTLLIGRIALPLLLLASLASCASGSAAVRQASLDIMYANAFIHGPAERLPPEKLDRKRKELDKAKEIYIKSDRLLATELERHFPGICAALDSGTEEPILSRMDADDVALLYWESAAIMSAFSLDPLDVSLSTQVKRARTLMARAYELDPDFGNGSLDEFYISFYGSLPSYLGGDKDLAKHHFEEAVRKSRGGSISAYTSYAMAVCVPRQDYAEWKRLMKAAMAVDVDKYPDRRLANGFARQKACWLYSKRDDLFLETEEE